MGFSSGCSSVSTTLRDNLKFARSSESCLYSCISKICRLLAVFLISFLTTLSGLSSSPSSLDSGAATSRWMTLGVSTGAFKYSLFSYWDRRLYVDVYRTFTLADFFLEPLKCLLAGLKGFRISLGSILQNLENLVGEGLTSSIWSLDYKEGSVEARSPEHSRTLGWCCCEKAEAALSKFLSLYGLFDGLEDPCAVEFSPRCPRPSPGAFEGDTSTLSYSFTLALLIICSIGPTFPLY